MNQIVIESSRFKSDQVLVFKLKCLTQKSMEAFYYCALEIILEMQLQISVSHHWLQSPGVSFNLEPCLCLPSARTHGHCSSGWHAPGLSTHSINLMSEHSSAAHGTHTFPATGSANGPHQPVNFGKRSTCRLVLGCMCLTLETKPSLSHRV